MGKIRVADFRPLRRSPRRDDADDPARCRLIVRLFFRSTPTPISGYAARLGLIP